MRCPRSLETVLCGGNVRHRVKLIYAFSLDRRAIYAFLVFKRMLPNLVRGRSG
jgi:hypothetical protein